MRSNLTGLLFMIFVMAHSGNPKAALATDGGFVFGADLSYVNQMEDCGAVYKENGIAKDVFRIFADQGTNLVRVRLWHDPSWWQEPLEQPIGVKPYYSDLEDVKNTIQRAREAGMQIMLDLHYSDFWADPGRQLIPRAWIDVATDVGALSDSVYNWTVTVLTTLEAEGLMPEIVKVGNENNGGILTQIPEPPPSFRVAETVASGNSWTRNAQIFNSAIHAVREVGATASINPKIALHWSNLHGLEWWYDQMLAHGVIDFDIMGFSYYYSWHGGSISQLEERVAHMASKHPNYGIMVVETGYLWSQDYGGIINEPDPEYLPVIPEKQLEYLVDYTRAVMRAGGTGVIFWEPAWVNTPCVTPWITGSSHTGVAFFDPQDFNFMNNGGGRWTNSKFYEDPLWPKVTFKVDMTGMDVSPEGIYITGSFTNGDGETWQLKPMAHEGGGIYSYFTYLPPGSTGGYYFLNGPNWDERESLPESCALWNETDRLYQIPNEDIVLAYTWSSCEPIGMGEFVEVIFAVDMTGEDVSRGVYLTGHIVNWEIRAMSHVGNDIYTYVTEAQPGDEGAYYYLTTSTWTNYQNYRETVPAECALWWGIDRGYMIPNHNVVFAHRWGSCEEFDFDQVTFVESEPPVISNFRLYQNYPNPFNPSTSIMYEIPHALHVTLTLYNVLGQEVVRLVDEYQEGGRHSVRFDSTELSSGMYVYRLQAGDFVSSRKLIVFK